jgi:phospholipase C
MATLPHIEHVVVAMLENRSLDNLCGWLYEDLGSPPSVFLPAGSLAFFNGLDPGMGNPTNTSYFNGAPPSMASVVRGTTASTLPNPDPEETFSNVTYQIYGPEEPGPDPRWPMQGFVLNYAATGAADPAGIMETYTPEQVPVLSALARNFAISDAWFASVPSQTWPNRSFVHAGTSNGHVDNGDPSDPLDWDVRTIFKVLEDSSPKITWSVFSDAWIAPSLTRVQFPELWDLSLDGHFQHFKSFRDACATQGALPQYSFLEPSFLFHPSDQHPPHDVAAGERFLYEIWQAVRSSPDWPQILLVILYDEHGGCFDHVLPSWGAAPPAAAGPGDEGFGFDRFGIRVPAVVVSPWIEAGTVFRSDTETPYDHASILATLRDWLSLEGDAAVLGGRVGAAPTLEQVLSREEVRTDMPEIPAPRAQIAHTSLHLRLNDLQHSLVQGSARRLENEPGTVMGPMRTRQDAIEFFTRGLRAAKGKRGRG